MGGFEPLQQGFGLSRHGAEGASDGVESILGLALEFLGERLGVALERVLECGALSFQRFTVVAQIVPRCRWHGFGQSCEIARAHLHLG